jgi:EAL domain-containing protein (putative c-di-GMP-specific phosphodiesterase class I)
VSVNVSARQLRQDDFVDQVVSALQRHGVPPAQLKLELTESMLLNDVQDVIGKMQALKAIGIGFSLDDFGTGYSSLGYLKCFPIDGLKIDRSFVRDLATSTKDAAIVDAIAALARSLGLGLVAEGVEDASQAEFLRARQCTELQGFLFSRPLPAEEATRQLAVRHEGTAPAPLTATALN